MPAKPKPSKKVTIHDDDKKAFDAIDSAFNRKARSTLTSGTHFEPNKRLATHKRIWRLEHTEDDAW